MINEAQAVALMNEANPVPDLKTYGVAQRDFAAYLDVLEQRSNSVTQLDTRRTEQTPAPKRTGMWLVAAIAVLVLGAVVVFLTQSEGPVATTPEQIEELATATLGDQLIEIGNYEERDGGWFFTVEFEELPDPEVIQSTTRELAEAFMLKGVDTIGVNVKTPEHEFGDLLLGANGAILDLIDTTKPVVIDWHPSSWEYVPEDYTFEGCVACP